MTLVGDPPTVRHRTRVGTLRRMWSLPVRAHVAALAVVLLALVPLVGPSASFSTDEGAAIVQAQSLSRGDGWIVEHPVPEVDPDGRHYPLELSERGPRGFVAFGKHPVYVLLLAGADRVGGVTAMVILSLAGTVAAAAASAALAGRLDRGLARPALWVVGLASPLLFDGFLVMAHTLGAALAAGAVLAAVAATDSRPTATIGHRLASAGAVAPLVAGAVAMRSEGLLFALALAVVAGAIAVRRRGRDRTTAVVIAVGALAAGVAAHLFETWWLDRIVGGGAAAVRAAPAAGDPTGWLSGRWRGLLRTLVTPTYGGNRLVTVLLLAMVVAIVGVAITIRRHPDNRVLARAGGGDGRRPPGAAVTTPGNPENRGPVLARAGGATVGAPAGGAVTTPGNPDGRGPVLARAAFAAIAAVLALIVGPATVVPGLLVAFPLMGAGVVLIRRSTLETTTARMSFAVFAIFAASVVATQYAVGGATEWGGRFFALGLPIVVPVLLLALKEQVTSLDRSVGRGVVAALAVCSLAMATMAVTSLRHQHRRLGQLVAMADHAGQLVAATDNSEHPDPVMVATYGSVPRWAWRTFDRQRWLTTTPDDLEPLLRRLRAAGITRIGLVTPDVARDEALLGPSVVVSSEASSRARGWHVLVVEVR